jgi:hypothetical protein
MTAKDKEFVIHIEDKEYKTDEPSLKGSELRGIAKPPIASDRDLILEVPGPGDDKKIQDWRTKATHGSYSGKPRTNCW